MSVQLIVYPQNYNGFYNATSSSPTEFIVNGINFANLASTSTYTSGANSPYPDTLSNAYPSAVNTWYRFRTNTSGTPDYPSVLAGNLELKSVAGAGSNTGVYQQLSNLTPGAQYTITLNITAVATGTIDIAVAIGQPNPITIYSGATYPVSTQITHTFTAVLSNDIVLIGYDNTVDDTVVITDLSIQPVIVGIPSGATNVLDNGQVICDLYEDEDLPLTLSVDDFKNVAEKVQSYSKAFNLPSTKRNNRIFDAIFEITRSYDGLIFNPYKRTQCVLKQDGFILFEGYLRMLDITDKEGEISYNVNLYSEVIALADTLKDRAFRDLDFTELEHDYNRTQINNSWNDSGTGITYNNPSTSGFRDDYSTVKYPFVDWNHQIIVGGSGATGATIGNPELTNLETAFRPFINIKYLIDRIFEASDFTYESAFFNKTDIKKLYMDFNWGSDENPNNVLNTGIASYVANETPTIYATTSFTNMVFEDSSIPTIAGFDNVTNTFTCPVGQDNATYNIGYIARVWATKDDSVSFRWRMVKGGVESFLDFYSDTLEGSAIVVVNYTLITGGSVVSVDIIDGGYYPSGAPTITLDSQFGAGATFTITMAGTAISSIAVNTPGGSYFSSDEMEFNVAPFTSPQGVTNGNITQTLDAGDTLELQWKALAYSDSVRQDNTPHNNNITSSNPRGTMVVSVSVVGITGDILLQTLRGELGQWDFLKGLITMFNLVTLVDEDNPNNILIEPYSDVFTPTATAGNTLANRGIEHDWTDKIDVSEMKLTPLTDLNKKTIFKFVEDDDDYSFNQYKNLVGGHLYGSQRYDVGNEFNILDGEEEIVAEPFAATVVKPLMSQFPDFITPAVYADGGDGSWEGFENSPRIMYNNGIKSTGASYYIPEQNGVVFANETNFLQFSHLSLIPTTSAALDFHFGICQLMPGVGVPTVNNLFNTYWLPYYSELYNPNTRTMTLKVNLSPADINTFKFNDRCFIKNRVFRVNKIDYKPNDLATVEFILIP